ncbi:MAG: IS30 family transposase [Candidatus Ryanbacteria bacterium]|nr:IS30 family transposase [Candidatus Ryanbacteria bacterium]
MRYTQQRRQVLLRYRHFSQDERSELAILLKKGYSVRAVAGVLERSPSSVSREIHRGSVLGLYNPHKAHTKASVKRLYSKYQGMKVRENPEIELYVRIHVAPPFVWSPEKIAGRLKRDTKRRLSVKTDTIYKYLYSSYGAGLTRFLRYRHEHKRRRKGKKKLKTIIPERISIDERPVVINERLRFGDWEGDTMGRSRRVSSQTLVVTRERLSRKLKAVKVPRLRDTVDGFEVLLAHVPALSLTLDNGVENARHRELVLPRFFCHPYSSWEKGSVEQAIGLIRRYIPKKADLSLYSQDEIDVIIERINNFPMRCLEWQTPNEVFEEQVRLFANSNCCT